MRQLKAAELLDDGPGEGPPLMAEQLALQQPRRNGGTIHRDEGVVPAGAELMDGAGEAFFARAGFPLEQDGGVRRCHDLHLPQHFLEGRAFADDLFTMVRSLEPIFDNRFASANMAVISPLWSSSNVCSIPIAIGCNVARCLIDGNLTRLPAKTAALPEPP